MHTSEPFPQTVGDKLREMRAGESRYFPADEAPASTVRSTITRLKAAHTVNYTTRPRLGGLMVWRLF